ncbi:unnamed protein product [Anisakis simplex]|uniref:DnaJ homolog subfamily C member 21 n=1 Tax=Anisakis simplex TaxID=6269 RepID=A0A0M3JUQ0_ANISI|nr:unnamed protein product [Anisakis simplex]
MRCHYEVLEVERTADDEQIKRAYRKLALKWHPDKNPDRIDECNQYFPLIQQAYDVLSDPQERAWYDRHRDQILRGGFDEHYQDNSLNLFSYFSSSCYTGFGDDGKGFYAVYRHVFETLAAEDYEFLSDDMEMRYPSFGDSKSSYEEVVGPFYGFWQSYSTARSFAWLDKYDIRSAPNRFVVRAMEKENKKLRDAGKKERNEEVRHLVAYVRKRDKRLLEYRKVLEAKKLEQQRKNEENRVNMIRESLRQMGEYKESEEVRQKHLANLREIEEALDSEFGVDSSEADSDGVFADGEEQDGAARAAGAVPQQLYCIVCEKAFKTEKAMANHERSKKHRDAVSELKKHMQDEDLLLLEAEPRYEDGECSDDERISPQDGVKTRGSVAAWSGSKKSKRQKRRDRKKVGGLDVADLDEGDHLDGEGTRNSDGDLENGVDIGLQDGQDEANFEASGSVVAGNSNGMEETTEETNIFVKTANLSVKKSEKDGVKKLKRRDGVVVGNKGQAKDREAAAGPRAAMCDSCGEVFESRTKLFAHLKSSGHATLKADHLPAGNNLPAEKKGKRK